jgi:hypothetical protein
MARLEKSQTPIAKGQKKQQPLLSKFSIFSSAFFGLWPLGF